MKQILRSRLASTLVATSALLATNGSWAAPRLGGVTDDSVCDVGSTEQRREGALAPREFIERQCKNGQLLVGVSVVPAGGMSEPLITALARTYCRIADVQVVRSVRDIGGLTMEYEEARCVISKLK